MQATCLACESGAAGYELSDFLRREQGEVAESREFARLHI